MVRFWNEQRKDMVIAACAALVMSFVLFGNGIGGDFIFDDKIVVVGNPFIDGESVPAGAIFSSSYHAYQPRTGLYRPLTILSYAVNAFLFGNGPASFHVVNIVLHAGVALLLWILIRRLTGNRWAPWFSLLVFLFLPIHVENVTSIVGRAELLALLFSLAAILATLDGRFILAGTTFFLGLLSKEMAVATLPIVAYILLFTQRTPLRMAWRPLIAYVPGIVVYALLRWRALGEFFLSNDSSMVYNPLKTAPWFTALWTSMKVFWFSTVKTLVPYSFSSDYSFPQISLVENPLASIETVAGLLLLAGCLYVMVRWRFTLWGLSAAIFLFSYFVVSNWIFKIGTIMAERLMYMPSIGIAMAAGYAFGKAYERQSLRKPIAVGVAALLVVYGIVIVDRNRDWSSEKVLFESAYAAAPHSVINRTNKALLYLQEKEYGEAKELIDAVVEEAPEHAPALNLAGHVYKALGMPQKSEEFWKRAIAARRDYILAYLHLGTLYYESGYLASAEQVLSEAVAIFPRWNEVFYLAASKTDLGKHQEAIDVVEKYFGTDPAQQELRFMLGLSYYRKGDIDKAIRYLQEIKDPKVSMEDYLESLKRIKIQRESQIQ